MKILSEATIGLEKSFPMMYSNKGLNSRETVPLKGLSHAKIKSKINADVLVKILFVQ